MCEPVSISLAAIGAASAAMAHQSAVAETDANNVAAGRTHDSARQNTINQQTQETRKFIEESRANQETGFDVELEKRAAQATAVAVGGAGGIQGATVEAIIAAEGQKGARNLGRVKDAQENSTLDFMAGVQAATDQGNANIAANPFQSGPSAMEGIMGTVMGGVKGYAAGGGLDGLTIGGGSETATSLGKKNMITNSKAGWYSPVG